MDEMKTIAGLSSVTQDTIMRFLEAKIQSNQLKITIEPGARKGDNFIGIVHRVSVQRCDDDSNATVTQSRNENDNTKKFQVIVKSAPQNTARRAHFNVRTCFLREIFIYNEVSFIVEKCVAFIVSLPQIHR